MASPTLLHGRAAAFALCGLLTISSASRAFAQGTGQEGRVPVLVELFTSEGCSDCPPADRLIEELDAKQPVPGARAIVLSEHVTYWNHQGWRDPFSFDDIDVRQKEYGDRFRLDSIYTPQAVIDGTAQLVGNNAAGVAKAVEKAAATPKKPLAIADAHWDNNAVSFTVHSADSGSRVVAVVAADAMRHLVSHGENAGRTLHHVAVVRSIKEFGSNTADGRVLRVSAGALAHDPPSAPVRLVVFQVDRKTGRVTAVNEQIVSR